MRLLDMHPNIVSLVDLWLREEDNELYITMELMDSDLHQIIQSKQGLSEPHHQCLMKQLLLGVQVARMTMPFSSTPQRRPASTLNSHCVIP